MFSIRSSFVNLEDITTPDLYAKNLFIKSPDFDVCPEQIFLHLNVVNTIFPEFSFTITSYWILRHFAPNFCSHKPLFIVKYIH